MHTLLFRPIKVTAAARTEWEAQGGKGYVWFEAQVQEGFVHVCAGYLRIVEIPGVSRWIFVVSVGVYDQHHRSLPRKPTDAECAAVKALWPDSEFVEEPDQDDPAGRVFVAPADNVHSMPTKSSVDRN